MITDRFCPLCDVALDLHDGPQSCHSAAPGCAEVALNHVTGSRDLSQYGESAVYPTGYGCEVCD